MSASDIRDLARLAPDIGCAHPGYEKSLTPGASMSLGKRRRPLGGLSRPVSAGLE